MYRDVARAILISVLILVFLDSIFFRILFRRRLVSAPRQIHTLVYRLTRVLINLVGLVSFFAVASSGFYPLLRDGSPIAGYRLMQHVASAAAFAAVSVLVTFFWAHRNRFTTADLYRFCRPKRPIELAEISSCAVVLRKIFFWTAVALSVPAALSITIAMFPLVGPTRQEDLFLIHRYCAIPLAAASLLFIYFSFVTWIESRAATVRERSLRSTPEERKEISRG